MPQEFDEVSTALHEPTAAKTAVRRRPRVAWRDANGDHAQMIDRPMLVGSTSRADLVIADGTVSRLHAELEPRKDGLWIRDLGSRNGTYVDGVQVGSARAADGATIRLGGATLTVNPAVETRIDLWHDDRFGPLVGRSSAMRELFAALARVAALDSTVLIEGETGTGKELVAHAIHAASPRAAKPFVIVDCAALPEQLLESELFGHAKGAFTGATAAREGAFEAAQGGTIFLDEIGELPLSMQPKLLRVLESRTVRRVGESTHRQIDLRIVSATNRDLRSMVNAGAFREDLYFRLAVLPVAIPPLRARMEDVELLIGHFLPQSTPAQRAELLREILDLPWLGNVRELRNFVERAVAFGPRQALAMRPPSGAPPPTPSSTSVPPPPLSAELTVLTAAFDKPFRDFRDDVERAYIERLMRRHSGNAAAAAQAAGIDRTYVYRLLRKHE